MMIVDKIKKFLILLQILNIKRFNVKHKDKIYLNLKKIMKVIILIKIFIKILNLVF